MQMHEASGKLPRQRLFYFFLNITNHCYNHLNEKSKNIEIRIYRYDLYDL